MQRKSTDKKFLAEDFEDKLEITRAYNSLLFDADGKRYIDFTSGWCVGNLGWSQHEIRAAVRGFDGPTYVFPHFYYQPWGDLATLLADITPGKLKKTFRATGGTEAVEIALQAAMLHTGRRKFVSIEGAYHGNSIGTGSIGDYSREQFPNLLPNCHKISPPLDWKAFRRLQTLLKRKDVAAFIMEPIMCNLGVLIPEPEFMQGVQELCQRYGTLLIIDEVATGFGRTGKLFACEHFKLEPDILCMAKAITGGYAPMGATIMTEEVAKSAQEAGFYSTYGWHPLSVAAALANIHYLIRHKENLMNNVADIGSYMEERLSAMEFEHPAILHSKGLAIGVDLGSAKYAKLLCQQSRKAGLLFSVQDSGLIFFPPLNIDRKIAREGLDILEECVHDMATPHRRKAS